MGKQINIEDRNKKKVKKEIKEKKISPEILIKMFSISEKLFFSNQKNPPIAALLYHDQSLAIKFAVGNKKSKKNKDKMQNNSHAEHLIFNKIESNPSLEINQYNLLITCPPCTNCLKEVVKLANKNRFLIASSDWLILEKKKNEAII